MAKLNTQTSIVDYLKDKGEDSSLSARKKLAESMGITNYTGSSAQNTQLLKALQSGKQEKEAVIIEDDTKSETKSEPKEAVIIESIDSPSDATAPKQNKLLGVDDELYNKAFNSSFEQSEDSKKAFGESGDALSNIKDLTSKEEIISSDVKKDLSSEFNVPVSVNKADKYLRNQLELIQSGKTSYSDQVKDMMDKIMNREKFSYDVDTDPLFQQALASAMNSGKQAMQDTIGQASALTGGYGSTYATSAGNQAYNAFIEDAYDNLPQYYRMAMEAYQMEGDEMYRQFGMLSELDDKEYNRNITAYDATYQHRNQMYNEAYTQYRDKKSDAFAMANLQITEHGQRVSDAYNYYNASSNYSDKLYEREYNSWLDSVNMAMKEVDVLNTDAWENKNFDESVRQYDQTFAENVRQYDQTFAENVRQYDQTFTEQKRQFDETLTEQKRQHDEQMSLNWAAFNKTGSTSGGSRKSGSTSSTLKTPTETQYKNALNAYNEGGMDKLNQYMNSVSDKYDKNAIANYVGTYGRLPEEQRTYTKVKDTTNWMWGVDGNDIVKDQYGNEFRVDELPESVQKEVSKLKKDESYTKK